MKVLHINSEKSWRGGEQQMIYLLETLSEEVESYICCRINSKVHDYVLKNEIPHLALKFKGFKLIDSLRLKKFVLSEKINIIHTHTSNAHTLAYYASIFGLVKPIIVSKRTDFPVRSPYKFNHKNIKRILCVSEMIKKITQRNIINKDRAVTVYSGIDTNRFEGEQKSLKNLLSLDDKKPLVGNTSAIAPHKDYYTFLRCAELLPNLNFVIIGDGPMELEIKNYVQTKKLMNVFFTGFLSNLNEYMKSLDLFLITSETEGLGTSILDAMICKVPVVATRAGGIPEIVIHKKTGLSSDVSDYKSLSHQISESLFKKPHVDEAFYNILQNFSKESTAKNTHNIYKSLMK